MSGLGSSYGEAQFVALCSCSVISVPKLYRLCTAHSSFRYMLSLRIKIANFNGRVRLNQSLYIH